MSISIWFTCDDPTVETPWEGDTPTSLTWSGAGVGAKVELMSAVCYIAESIRYRARWRLPLTCHLSRAAQTVACEELAYRCGEETMTVGQVEEWLALRDITVRWDGEGSQHARLP